MQFSPIGPRALLCLSVLTTAGCYDLALDETRRLMREVGALQPPYDALLVPGCPSRPDGTPSTCIRRRVRVAVLAWQRGWAPRILFSGGAVHTVGVEAQVMADEARRLGVPAGALVLETTARHTTENFDLAARILLPRGWRRVLIVSDTFQLPFAWRFARRAGLECALLPTVPLESGARVRAGLELDDVEPIKSISWW